MHTPVRRRSAMLAAGGLFLGGSTAHAQAGGPIAHPGPGRLRGGRQGDVLAFLGIPYVAPPVGEGRYRSPRPQPGWDGVRDASRPGPASIQTLGGAAAWLYEGAEPQSEDCLYLNVWTPGTVGRRPVMVWLHGGAWRTGHGAVAGTNGRWLAEHGDVVVVTVNYRLGALGWLAHPDLADEQTGAYANWGLQDQAAALRWVRDNIAAFGGDPGNVTLFGQSAGGSSTASLAQDPANAGLIHRMIVQSGSLHGAPGFPEPPTAAAYAEALAKRLDTSVRGLRELPARQVHEAELALARDPTMVRSLGRPPVLPVLDGVVLKVWPRDGALAPVPLLIGTTRDEGAFWHDLVSPDGKPVPGLRSPATDEDLAANIRDLAAIYRPEVSATDPTHLAAAYRRLWIPGRGEALNFTFDPKVAWIAAYTDVVFRLRALEAAQRHAAAGQPTWQYEFARPLAPPARYVPHTAEIPFVFGTYADPFFAAKTGADEAAAELSAHMLQSWASFARTGVPTGMREAWRPVLLGVDGRAEGVNVLGMEGGTHIALDRVLLDRRELWGL